MVRICLDNDHINRFCRKRDGLYLMARARNLAAAKALCRPVKYFSAPGKMVSALPAR